MSLGRTSRWLIAVLAAFALVASACGDDSSSDSGDSASGDGDSDICVDGDTVSLGLLNSTTGAMAISEQTVRDSLLMAVDEINADGGILDKQIVIVEEDGQSEPTVFA
jgi:urea transport system substrate-binding protein